MRDESTITFNICRIKNEVSISVCMSEDFMLITTLAVICMFHYFDNAYPRFSIYNVLYKIYLLSYTNYGNAYKVVFL